jgi:hypothetical protein
MAERHRSPRRLVSVALCLTIVLVAVVAVAIAGGLRTDSKADQSEYVSASSLTRPKTPGQVVFNSDFESADFNGWLVQSLPGRARVVAKDAYEGKTDARFEVREGDVEPQTGSSRSEVSGPTFDAGEDLYIRDAIRVPAADTFRGPWQIIQQLHETDWGGSPGIAVFLNQNHSLKLGAGDGSPTYWRGPRLSEDKWHNLVYRVKLSRDPRVGFVEVWLDGRKRRLTNGHFRANGETIQAAQTYLKLGIYRSRDSHGTSVVEHDDVIVIARHRPGR